jgi:PAS domain S-box-containing protein
LNSSAKTTGRILKPRSVEATKLDVLISHYSSLDEQLRQEIEADREVDAIQFLDHQLQKVLSSLKDYRATDRQEAFKHLMFFLGGGGGSGSDGDPEHLSARPTDPEAMHHLLTDYLLKEQMAPLPAAELDLQSIIDNSTNRISLINLNHEYQYTSHSNAAHYGGAQHEIQGKHVAEIIGHQRFNGRAKSFFDKCFGGQLVEYAHTLESDQDQTSFLKCRMQPHFDATGAVAGAIVTMTDISEELLLGVQGINCVPLSDDGEELTLR